MTELPYMAEPWFAMLLRACDTGRGGKPKAAVAAELGVSAPMVYQVLNGTGEYGKGKAQPTRLAQLVLHRYGSYACPHLSEQDGAERVITGEQCRAYSHREPPTHSPRDLAHWQACRNCEHRPLAAPQQQRPVVPRKGRQPAAQPEAQPALPGLADDSADAAAAAEPTTTPGALA